MEVMAMGGAGADAEMEISVSGCSSTTSANTSAADDELGVGRGWADFYPVVDWGMFGDEDDFQGLIESMMACDAVQEYKDRRGCCFALGDLQEGLAPYDATPSNSGVSTLGSCADVPVAELRVGGDEPNISSEEEEEEEEEEENREDEDDGEREDMKGLRLVHLLMAAAEALTGENGGLDLARVILVRLKEMASLTAASNMERLAACFTDALQALLDASSSSSGCGKHSAAHHHHHHHHQKQQLLQQQQQPHPGDALAAFQLLQDMSPYVKFGHFTANQAILEAVAGERRVHILDYDIMEGVQWASLIQALVSRRDGPPPPHLRITAVSRGAGGASCHVRRPIGTIQETGRRLAAFAASVGQPFSFGQCRLDAEDSFRPAGLKLVKGEALVVNCMLHLPHSAASHRPALSVASFLSGAASLGPRLVTLVEEETGGAAAGGSFVDRFMDSLHHYSAVYDSLEAGFPMHGRARALVERVFLGPRIAGTVCRVYQTSGGGAGGGDVEVESWSEWMGKMGFRKVGISFSNRCQAKLLVGLFNEGHRVEEAAANKLVLAWKSRRLLSASVWTGPAAPPPLPAMSPCSVPFSPGAAAAPP